MPDVTLEREILAVGTYRDTRGRPMQVTERDLEEFADNFEKLRAHVKPPLKLGHDGNQALLAGQKDGDPALGWVTGLKKRGSKLIATMANIPARLDEMIRNGRYRRVSIEATGDFAATDWEKNLKTGVRGKVLTGVALLGADLPQCANLEDLATLLASDTGTDIVMRGERYSDLTFRLDSCPRTNDSDESEPKEHDAMAEADIKMLQEQVAKLTADAAERDRTMAEQLADAERKLGDTTAKLSALEAEAQRLKADADAAREREAQALAAKLEADADEFVRRYSVAGDNLRLTTEAAKAYARGLFVALSGVAGNVEVITSEQSAELKLSDKGAAITAAEALDGLMRALPSANVLLKQVADPSKGATGATSFDDAMLSVAKEHKLNLKDKGDYAKALDFVTDLASKDPAAFGFRAPHAA